MSHAVPIQTEIPQFYQGQIASASGRSDNILSKQSLTNDGASFDDVMTGQLKGTEGHVQASTEDSDTGESGNVLPVDGKYFPLTGLNTTKQPGNIDPSSVNGAILLMNQNVPGEKNILFEKITDTAKNQNVPESLSNPDTLSGLTGPGDVHGSYNSRASDIETAVTALTQNKTPLNHSPDGNGVGRYIPVDLKPGQPVVTDSCLADTLSVISQGNDPDAVTSSTSIDRNYQSDINIGVSEAIRQFLHLRNDKGYSGIYKGNNIGLESASLGQQLDGQSIGTTDGYTVGLHQTGQGTDLRSLPTFQITQPVTSSQWNNEFADRVRWLVSGNIKKAEISLVPKNLGAIEISISVHNDQTNISINAHTLQSRDVIEGSLPRLREMFDQAGMGDVNVDVSQHSDSNAQFSQSYEQDNQKYHKQDDEVLVSTVHEIQHNVTRGDVLVDLYA